MSDKSAPLDCGSKSAMTGALPLSEGESLREGVVEALARRCKHRLDRFEKQRSFLPEDGFPHHSTLPHTFPSARPPTAYLFPSTASAVVHRSSRAAVQKGRFCSSLPNALRSRCLQKS